MRAADKQQQGRALSRVMAEGGWGRRVLPLPFPPFIRVPMTRRAVESLWDDKESSRLDWMDAVSTNTGALAGLDFAWRACTLNRTSRIDLVATKAFAVVYTHLGFRATCVPAQWTRATSAIC